MAHKVMIGGTAYEVKGGSVMVDGTAYQLTKGRTLIDGTGYDIVFGRTMTLAELAEGSVVLLNEGDSQVEFYVAKHDYESELNGTGRTLIARKENHSSRQMGSGISTYSGSSLNKWLNDTYKFEFDAGIRNAMGTTKFYTAGDGTGHSEMSGSVFLLSHAELGGIRWTDKWPRAEGTELATKNLLRSSDWAWTRSRYRGNSTWFCVVTTETFSDRDCSSYAMVRPVFTLPGETLVTASAGGTYTVII